METTGVSRLSVANWIEFDGVAHAIAKEGSLFVPNLQLCNNYSLPMEPVSRALVTTRILEQVQLVIILRIPPRSRFHNLSHNPLPDGREMLVLYLLCNTLRNGLLFRGVIENTRSIFCARCSVIIQSSQRRKLTSPPIRPLSVQGRRVMGAIEKLCNSTQFRSGRISND